MIKNLVLVRHGKAVSDYNSSSDIDRPLKEKGIYDSYNMAKRLVDKDLIPELILSSTAARALHTATIFARVFELNSSKILLNDDLYLASPDTIIDIICKTDTNINSLIVVGHNPGLAEISSMLSGDIIDLPTTGLVSFKFDIQFWPDILSHRPMESIIDYPKNI